MGTRVWTSEEEEMMEQQRVFANIQLQNLEVTLSTTEENEVRLQMEMIGSLMPGCMVDTNAIDLYILRLQTACRQKVHVYPGNFYSNVISKPNSHVYQNASENPFENVAILMPVHLGSTVSGHWLLVCVYESTIYFYDSLGVHYVEKHEEIFKKTSRYLNQLRVRHNLKSRRYVQTEVDVPQQAAGSNDCGIVVLAVADCLLHGVSFENLRLHRDSYEEYRKQIVGNLILMINGQGEYSQRVVDDQKSRVPDGVRNDSRDVKEKRGTGLPTSNRPTAEEMAAREAEASSERKARAKAIKRERASTPPVGLAAKQPKYRCNKCSKYFRHKLALARHVQTHNTLIYRCSCCPYLARTFSGRNRHERQNHGLKRTTDLTSKEPLTTTELAKLQHRLQHKLKCECGRVFSSKQKYNTHLCVYNSRRAGTQTTEQPTEQSTGNFEPRVHVQSPNNSATDSESVGHVDLESTLLRSVNSTNEEPRPGDRFPSPTPTASFSTILPSNWSSLRFAVGPFNEWVKHLLKQEVLIYDYKEMSLYGELPIGIWKDSAEYQLLFLRLQTTSWEGKLSLPSSFLCHLESQDAESRTDDRTSYILGFAKPTANEAVAAFHEVYDSTGQLEDLIAVGVRQCGVKSALVIVNDKTRKKIKKKILELNGVCFD